MKREAEHAQLSRRSRLLRGCIVLLGLAILSCGKLWRRSGLMTLELRPTGLGSGIDKDRPDLPEGSGEWSAEATSAHLSPSTSIALGPLHG